MARAMTMKGTAIGPCQTTPDRRSVAGPGAGAGAYLQLDGIQRRFGRQSALQGVSFSAGQGEILCLAGPSGCGKSTLLRIVSGVERPDGGQVLLDGQRLAGDGAHVPPEKRGIGFMVQDYALFPHLDVTGNILFGLTALPHANAAVRCRLILDRLGIGHLAARFPHMLSGGEQQRVALARALAPGPRVLLMDEPFSNLDPRLRDDVRAESLAIVREFGATVLLVTHDPQEALSAGDRVALMDAGRIVQIDSGETLYARPASAYAAEFFGAVNKIAGSVDDGILETPLGRFAATGRPDGPATLYLRPQHIRLSGDENGIAGQVTERRFLGEIEQIGIAVPALVAPLILRSSACLAVNPGDRVRLAVEDGHALIF